MELATWIKRTHHAHAAELASQKIETELRVNLYHLHEATKVNAFRRLPAS